MPENKAEAVKYKILRFLDIIGFTVFDPIVRLAFGESPAKQIEKIIKYLIIPILFITVCVIVWWVVAPNHKTKSGEVPTPNIVWQSALINDRFSEREKLKESDFLLEGEERVSMLNIVKSKIESERENLKVLGEKLAFQEESYESQLNERISPIKTKLNALAQENKAANALAKSEINQIAESLIAGESSPEDLLATIKKADKQKSEARDAESILKKQIEDIRSEKYKPLEQARLDFNSVADEIQFMKKRIDFLSTSNRSVKVSETKLKLDENINKLENALNPRSAISEAKRIIRTESSIIRLEEQKYASAMTIYKQIQRSIFTVFVGFIMAALIAIPLGVLCGLNSIVMACFTPIISIFKPVSPVVYLLIFQIIVGAFFPDPESHPFFLFLNSLPLIGGLGINPALVFSACTVAACAVWPALINTALGVASIDKDHINVARVLKLNFLDRLTKIVIPSALPLVFAGLRISLGVGWMVLIAAEALSSSDGLGKFVWDEYQNGSSFSFANILYACFVVGGIGFLLDRMMIVLQRLVSFDRNGTSL